MNVIEIFSSIDGEGSRQGLLTTFLRLHDCNIRCSYCDTTYSYGIDSVFTEMTAAEVANVIESFGNHRITITGGEPLLQEAAVVELIDELNRRNVQTMQDNTLGQIGSTCIIDIDKFDKREMLNNSLYDFNIETNGTIIPSFHRDNVWFTYDYKTPSSLAEESMNVGIFKAATERDLIKFVVGSPEDLDCMRRIIDQYPTAAQIYVSPVWGQIEAASIIDYMKAYNLQNVRFQLQIHKFVWDPDAKGV
ncbi:4Fe-4S cluster-binding domain-containing protein [uncultured Veillonella sp.]|uniref:4Fe-4S cluster-binding domain-containing protein n=1 Tax=uncultured Veillonella sp. TaxID=159268 RepID=UPI0025D03750|nr:4Fe-4S cluster-binding domain-containing protein [uncultured Veillonella sp.]